MLVLHDRDKYLYQQISLNKWFHSVVVSTPDFESGDLGSNPGGTSFLRLCVFGYIYDMPSLQIKLANEW